MKKTLLFLLCCISTIHLPASQLAGLRTNAKSTGSKNTLSSDISPAYTILKYCNEQIETGVGYPTISTFSGAVYFPASTLAAHAGKKIQGIRIGLAAPSTDLTLFITSTLGGDPVYEQAVGAAASGWKSIELAAPFEITGEAFYIGYTCTGIYQMGFSGSVSQNAALIKLPGQEWADGSSFGWGSLCLQAVIPGDNLPQADMGILSVETSYAATGEPVLISAVSRNNTFTPVTSYQISCTAAGREPVISKYTKTLKWFEQDTIKITLDPIMERGTYDVSVTITEVNDGEDEYADNNTEAGIIKTRNFTYPKKVVAEVGTSIQCGFCPKGIVGMDNMKLKYPDTFIGIAVHNTLQGVDPLVVPAYNRFQTTFFKGNPACVVNRKTALVGDPYSDIENFYLQEAVPSEIGISLTAKFGEEEQKTILASASAVFGFTTDNADYRIAYILIENKVIGYSQINYYADNARGEMGGFEKLPEKIPAGQIEFDDVARGIYQYDGIAGSIPAAVVENQAVAHEHKITVPYFIKNKSELELIAVLIDTKTKEIVNADKTVIQPYQPNSISGTFQDNNITVHINNGLLYIESEHAAVQSISIYNTKGQNLLTASDISSPIPVDHLSKGIYLIKMNTAQGSRVIKVVK